MLSSKANVIMASSGANVIIWCYHVMLSSVMITPPFFIFPGNFTHSLKNLKNGNLKVVYISDVKAQKQQKTYFLNLMMLVKVKRNLAISSGLRL
jgi:hypothetical protein